MSRSNNASTKAADTSANPVPMPAADEGKPEASVAVPQKPSTALTAHDDLGTGFEDFTQDDLAVPFLNLLQKGSPQVEDENPKRIAGAKAGSFMNSVTSEIYDGKEGVVLIPVHRTRSFIEWVPRKQGGGLVKVYQPDVPEVQGVLAKAGRKFGKLKINDDNDLMETFSVFSLLLSPDGFTTRVIVSFASSQIGMYKKWMTTARGIQVRDEATGRVKTPAMWSHRYRLSSFFFQKKEDTWYKYLVKFDGADAAASRITEDDQLMDEAKDFRALLLSGQATANYESAQQDVPDAEAEFEM